MSQTTCGQCGDDITGTVGHGDRCRGTQYKSGLTFQGTISGSRVCGAASEAQKLLEWLGQELLRNDNLSIVDMPVGGPFELPTFTMTFRDPDGCIYGRLRELALAAKKQRELAAKTVGSPLGPKN